MTDLIAGLALALILGAAIAYIVKAKRAGVKCIGCPAAGNCSSKGAEGSEACSCGCNVEIKIDPELLKKQ